MARFAWQPVSGRVPRLEAVMPRENQDPFFRKAERGDLGDAPVMSNRLADAFNAMLCPACTRPMTYVRTIWRALQDDLQVFECRACNVSLSVKVPPKP
jgi:hypothetical protein